MRSLLFATCLALGAGSVALVAPAQARVNIDLPGIHIGDGYRGGEWRHDGWRRHEEWRRREAYRDHWGYEHRYNRYGYNDWR
jgi:hypothetical protein